MKENDFDPKSMFYYYYKNDLFFSIEALASIPGKPRAVRDMKNDTAKIPKEIVSIYSENESSEYGNISPIIISIFGTEEILLK